MTPRTVEEVAAFSEQAARNDQWWYEFGRQVGIAEGRAQVEAELEADWRERQRISPRINPNSPSFAELQRRRGVA
jgi:hypothetical protein